MRILILGGDGYLGWPTAMAFAAKMHDVWVVDNYLRRVLAIQTNSEALVANPNLPERARLYEAAGGGKIRVSIGDCRQHEFLNRIFAEFRPEAVVHYAEQPSAPYSMIGHAEAQLTLENNLATTLNIVFAVQQEAPDCHIIKLGTMGEYGTPNIDIEEGWIEINHKGRRERFLYPRQAGSLYHTTKIMDTDLLWFYVRTYGLRVTDLMQGPVYGLVTDESAADDRLEPNFHYDDIFGTVINRFVAQAVAGVPLTVYGQGGQTRGYLNLKDTLQCIELAAKQPADRGQLRILNQFVEVFSVVDLADRVRTAGRELGLDVSISHISNPRKEAERHYYNPVHEALPQMGLQPHPLTTEVLQGMISAVGKHKARIDVARILPRVTWK